MICKKNYEYQEVTIYNLFHALLLHNQKNLYQFKFFLNYYNFF